MSTCRVCGCTDEAPCFSGELTVFSGPEVDALSEQQLEQMNLTPCSWLEADLCTACVHSPPAPLLFAADGRPLRGAP
jgi:hypothetical protein